MKLKRDFKPQKKLIGNARPKMVRVRSPKKKDPIKKKSIDIKTASSQKDQKPKISIVESKFQIPEVKIKTQDERFKATIFLPNEDDFSSCEACLEDSQIQFESKKYQKIIELPESCNTEKLRLTS